MRHSQQLAPFAALLTLACGSGEKKNPPPPEPPKSAPTSPKEAPPTPTAPEYPAVLDKVPSSSFFVMSFGRPEEDQKLLLEFFTKSGLAGEGSGWSSKQALEEFRKEMGFDLFDTAAWAKIGIDPSKGIALAFDQQLLRDSYYHDTYAGIVRHYANPANYVVVATKDFAAFDKWARETKDRDDYMSYTYETVDIKGRKATFVYEGQPKTPPTMPPIERLPAPPPMPIPPGAPPMDITPPLDNVLAKRAVPADPPARPAEAPILEPAIAPAPAPIPMPPPPPPSAETKRLDSVWFQDGDFAYVFMDINVETVKLPEVPDAVDTFKNGLGAFLDRNGTPLTKSAGFLDVAKKTSPKADFFLYLDIAVVPAVSQAGGDVRYLPPTDDNQKRVQDQERAYEAESAKLRQSSADDLQVFASLSPRVSFSVEASATKVSGTGYMPIAPALQPLAQAAFTPSAKAPDYGTIFDPKSTFVMRGSVPLASLKALVMALAPAASRPGLESNYAQTKTAFSMVSGLDLDADVLGALTGHMAVGGPDMSLFTSFLTRPGEGAPPSFVGVAQLTSAAAGDKIIDGIKKGLASAGGPQLSTEDVGGVSLYSFTDAGVTLAFARAGDFLVGGLNPEVVRATIQRIQTPGASFAASLSPLGQAVISEPNANGCTGDLGGLFTWIRDQNQPSDPGDLAILNKLSGYLGAMSMKMQYADGAATCSCELILK